MTMDPNRHLQRAGLSPRVNLSIDSKFQRQTTTNIVATASSNTHNMLLGIYNLIMPHSQLSKFFSKSVYQFLCFGTKSVT